MLGKKARGRKDRGNQELAPAPNMPTILFYVFDFFRSFSWLCLRAKGNFHMGMSHGLLELCSIHCLEDPCHLKGPQFFLQLFCFLLFNKFAPLDETTSPFAPWDYYNSYPFQCVVTQKFIYFFTAN